MHRTNCTWCAQPPGIHTASCSYCSTCHTCTPYGSCASSCRCLAVSMKHCGRREGKTCRQQSATAATYSSCWKKTACRTSWHLVTSLILRATHPTLPGRASRHVPPPASQRAPCAQMAGSPQSCLQARSRRGCGKRDGRQPSSSLTGLCHPSLQTTSCSRSAHLQAAMCAHTKTL